MKHLAAVRLAVEDAGLDHLPRRAPLIELCCTLAGQMDSAGQEPSTRLTAAYLSALKDLRRAADDKSSPCGVVAQGCASCAWL
jgi:hypothetical protein